MKLTRLQIRSLIVESLNEAHGLSDGDVAHLQKVHDETDDTKLKDILKNLIKSNVEVEGDKSVNVATPAGQKKIRKNGSKK
tara:strand:- start:14614 stop:14856 length:243 start_codon:yes stop_codon:yes gene_type:complete